MEVEKMNVTISGLSPNTLTPDGRSSAVIVFAALTVVFSAILTLLRVLVAVRKKIQIRSDDIFIFMAVVGFAFHHSHRLTDNSRPPP